MSLARWQTISFICAITYICIAAWGLQTTLLFNNDVQWLMTATSRLLADGTYTRDFFEPNPPLILFLYVPPLLLIKYFSLTIITAVKIYIFSLGLLVFSLAYFFIRKIFLPKDLLIANVFAFTLLAAFLIIPFGEFAQREHLIFILSIPYLLAVAFRLNGNTLNRYLGMTVGLLSAVGFGIKPHFLIIPILIEIYYLINKKSLFAFLRTETLTMLAFYLCYLGIVFVFYPDYVSNIIPYTARLYYLGYGDTWLTAIFNPIIFFCCLPALLCLFLRKQNTYPILTTILQLAFLGFLLGYLIQHKRYFYQSLPLFSTATLLMVMCLNLLRQHINFQKSTYAYLGVFGAVTFAFLYFYNNIIWTKLLFHPREFYGYFAVLLILLLCSFSDTTNWFKRIGFILAVIGFSFFVSSQLSLTPFYSHRFFITVTLIVVLFSFFLPNTKQHKLQTLFITLFAAIFFMYPYGYASNMYAKYLYRRNAYVASTLNTFLETHAKNKTVYYFWTGPYSFPEFKTVNFGARFPFFWMLPGLVINDSLPMDSSHQAQQTNDKKLFIHMVLEDLTTTQPDYIFIDDRIEKAYFHGLPFDYLTFFSQSASFKDLWKNYHYVTTLQGPKTLVTEEPIFKLKVYEHTPELASRSVT